MKNLAVIIVSVGILVFSNLTFAIDLEKEDKKITIKQDSHRHTFNIKRKVEGDNFWVYGLAARHYSGVDSIYLGNFQLISFSDMPKYRDIFIMLENTFKGNVAYVYQIPSEKEEDKKSSGYKGMFVPGSRENEANPLDKVLKSSVNYFFIAGNNNIGEKIKLIQKSDIIALKGYIVNLESATENGRKISLSRRMLNSEHFIIEDVEIVDLDNAKFNIPKNEPEHPFSNLSNLFVPKSNNFKISAIIFAPPNNSEVIIENKKLKEGDVIKDAKIKRINKNSVILEIEGKDVISTIN